MAKFTSYDGIDTNGVRAEVVVQTGSGRIKEISPKGSPNQNGKHRNMEVVFDPDNPHLKRKVYANLDTTSESIYNKVLEAHKNQETVNYRIESVRRKNVDRSKPFEDLIHTEEVVRILAAIDDVFADEARTDPLEDPSRDEAPSALQQRLQGAPNSPSAGTPPPKGVERAGLVFDSADDFINHTVHSNAALPSPEVLYATQGYLLSVGQGLSRDDFSRAVQESDGGGYGTPDMTVAIEVERFAIELLMDRYNLHVGEVSNKVFAQAASATEEILKITDNVYQNVAEQYVDSFTYRRGTQSYRNILSVTQDTILRREGLPVFTDPEECARWREDIAGITQERVEMIKLIITGSESVTVPDDEIIATVTAESTPESITETVDTYMYTPESSPPVETYEEADDLPPVPNFDDEGMSAGGIDALVDAVGGATPTVSYPDFRTTQGEFIAPSTELVMSLKELCETAGVMENKEAIVGWLEFHLGKRKAQEVNSENLERFIAFYRNEGSDLVRSDVLSFKRS